MIALRAFFVRAAAAALLTASASASLSAAASAAPRYDGLWSVAIVTQKGDCDGGYRYPIRIVNGMLVNGGENPFTISGRVTRSGAITVKVSHGSESAIGSGRLDGNSGGGLWHAGACSGTWSAERRSS